MQTTSLLQLPTLPSRSLWRNFQPANKTVARKQKRPLNCIFALKRDHHEHGKDHYSGKLVDDDMIVLRMRIREMKMEERNDEAPSDWMEWEKRWYYSSYDSDVCKAVGFLQSVLMETRPSVALVMLAIVMLSVPTSFAFVLHHLMDLLR